MYIYIYIYIYIYKICNIYKLLSNHLRGQYCLGWHSVRTMEDYHDLNLNCNVFFSAEVVGKNLK